jgi:chemotaxis protein histidine kinase CheA
MAQPQPKNQNGPRHHVLPPEANLREKCLRPGDPEEAAREAIARAEKALDDLSVNFDEWMEIESKRLACARDMATVHDYSKDSLSELFQAAHNLKGQASTLCYPFADDICASLCRLIEKTPDTARLPRPLVDQHVDAVRALVNENAKGNENPKASVLAKRLRDVTNDYLKQIAERPVGA